MRGVYASSVSLGGGNHLEQCLLSQQHLSVSLMLLLLALPWSHGSWTELISSGPQPPPRRAHASVQIESKNKIFIFGGATNGCSICEGGPIETVGVPCNASTAAAVCQGGSCVSKDHCLLNDAWTFNVLSFEFTPLQLCSSCGDSVVPPAVEGARGILWQKDNPDAVAVLVWGGRTYSRSACPSTSLTKDCFSTAMFKFSLSSTQTKWVKMETLSELVPAGE
eukprot:765576-Hanusia_phi.AAC.8